MRGAADRVRLLCAVLLGLTTACRAAAPSMVAGVVAAGQVLSAQRAQNVIRGKVDLGSLAGAGAGSRYRTQSTYAAIASFATVSFIDTVSNTTVSTTVTDGSGTFALSLGGTFTPAPGEIYYLEAVKGLYNNQAGHSAARVRTLISFRSGGWVSMTNNIPNVGIVIDRSTTALAVITSLYQAAGVPVTPAALLGVVQYGVPNPAQNNYDWYTPGSSGISSSDYVTVTQQVDQIVASDQDPVAVLLFNASTHTFSHLQTGFTVNNLSPATGSIGTTVVINGANFDPVAANDVVKFNGVQATVTAATNNQLTVVVPAGALSGTVSVAIGGLVLAGLTFSVVSSDGHTVYDLSGNLYVASQQTSEIYTLSPAGALSKFASSGTLSGPQGLAYANGTGNLYVASTGNSTIALVSSSGTVTSFSTAVASPRRVLVDGSGTVWAATQTAIYKLTSAGAIAQSWTAGFNDIRGLAFYGGALYVADYGQNAILEIANAAGGGTTVTTFMTGLSGPSGLAFDTSGNLYVANYLGNNVVTINALTSQMTSLASVTNPEGLAFNTNGTFYTTSQYTHTLYGITMNGSIRAVAIGPNDPASVNVAPSGDVTFVNRDGAELMRATDSVFMRPVVSGFANPRGMVYVPSSGNYYVANYNSNAIIRANGSGQTAQLATVAYPDNLAYYPAGNQLAVLCGSGNPTEVDTINLATNALASRYNYQVFGYQPAKFVMDPSGNLYGVSTTGQIYMVATPSSEITPQLNATSLPATPWGLFYESSGSLLVTFPSLNKVSRLNVSTGALTDVVTSGLNQPRGVVEDGSNNLYVANYGANTAGAATITRWSSGTSSTLWSYSGASTDPYEPSDMTLLGSVLYVANVGWQNVTSYNLSTAAKAVPIPYGSGSSINYQYYYYGGAGYTLTANAAANTVYASYTAPGSPTYYAIAVYNAGTSALSWISNPGSYQGNTICYYPAGNQLYVGYSYAILRANVDGTNARTFESIGYYYWNYGSPPTANCLYGGLAYDSSGNMYVGDSGVINKINASNGHITPYATLAGYGGNVLNCVQFNPANGEIWACDTNNLYKAPSGGGTLTSVTSLSYISSFGFHPTNNTLYALTAPVYGGSSTGYNVMRQYNVGLNTWSYPDFWCYQPRF